MGNELTHSNVLQDLGDAQEADHDGRIKAREADHFVNKKDGQWEPDIVQMYDGKPRYTIDLTSGIVADVDGEMNSMDFDIKVSPAGGSATTDIALHYDGLIRNIENNSTPKAKYIYRAAGKQMITTGIGGFGIEHGYRDPMSFDQDLMFYPISNFMDRVWFDPNFELQDASDSNWGFKLTTMSKQSYLNDFPKGSCNSIGQDREGNVYSYKDSDSVTVAQYLYKVSEKVRLLRMTNGSIFQEDDKFTKVKDELAAQGVTVEKHRDVMSHRIHQQMLDGSDFLSDKEKTVFSYVPLVPMFGNFEISEDKVIYWGVVEKNMDPQRILNYAESRKIAEGALAPRKKLVMTREQAAGSEKAIRTMNTNDDPVLLLKHIPDQTPPFETGGASINPGLMETTESMKGYLQSIPGRMDPSRQGSAGLQSGVALQALQNKSDNSNYGYFISAEIALCHGYRIAKDAIPRVYDAQREVQLDFQDGTTKSITINQRVYDQQTQKVIDLNDLSKGVYSVTCSAGPAFSNKQQETIAAMNEVAAIAPEVLQQGMDVYLSNVPAPGMDKIAKRVRAQMLDNGQILEEEMTDEEKEQQQAKAQQPKEQSPMDQALIAEAAARTKEVEAKTADVISKTEERKDKTIIDIEKIKIQDEQNEKKNMLEFMKLQNEQINEQADTLKALKEAMGVDTIITDSSTQAYNKQADKLLISIVDSMNK